MTSSCFFLSILSWNLGVSTCWNPQGLSRAVQGLLYARVPLRHCPLSNDRFVVQDWSCGDLTDDRVSSWLLGRVDILLPNYTASRPQMTPAFIIFCVTAVPVKAVNIIGWDHRGSINPLALELDIYSLAHNLCKMWIFYEPRRVTLGNTRNFVEE